MRYFKQIFSMRSNYLVTPRYPFISLTIALRSKYYSIRFTYNFTKCIHTISYITAIVLRTIYLCWQKIIIGSRKIQ
ncbi:hypothetical protein LEQ41_03850 [Streptococcus agalactiae]|nr:hypothetical protein [Streptococcus agalactiae]